MWKANILNCSASATGNLSTVEIIHIQIPPDTDWFVLQNTNLEYFCLNDTKDVSVIEIPKNHIRFICVDFWDVLQDSKNISLDISQNNLETLPQKIKELKSLQQIWLSGNPFLCDCNMTWMIDWLSHATTPSGEHVVVDYTEVRCQNGTGSWEHQPIYQLSATEMDCYHENITDTVSDNNDAEMVYLILLVIPIFLILLLAIFCCVNPTPRYKQSFNKYIKEERLVHKNKSTEDEKRKIMISEDLFDWLLVFVTFTTSEQTSVLPRHY